MSWFRFKSSRLALSITLKFYSRVAKRYKLKVRKFWRGPFWLIILKRVNHVVNSWIILFSSTLQQLFNYISNSRYHTQIQISNLAAFTFLGNKHAQNPQNLENSALLRLLKSLTRENNFVKIAFKVLKTLFRSRNTWLSKVLPLVDNITTLNVEEFIENQLGSLISVIFWFLNKSTKPPKYGGIFYSFIYFLTQTFLVSKFVFVSTW